MLRQFSQDQSPIILLDVDETLILTESVDGQKRCKFNAPLIDALVKAKVTEVYLLSSCSLHSVIATAEGREAVGYMSRLQLIQHLEAKGITVKAVMTDNDLTLGTPRAGQEMKSDTAWLNNTPGSYYDQHIKPFEHRVLDDPSINFVTDPDYVATRETEQKHGEAARTIKQYYKHPHVKKPLSDMFFTAIGNGRPVLFLDDSRENLGDVAEIAKKHNVYMNYFEVTKKSETDDYVNFLSIPPRDVAFIRNWIVSSDASRDQQLIDHIAKKMHDDPDFNVVLWRDGIIKQLAAEMQTKNIEKKNVAVPVYQQEELEGTRAAIRAASKPALAVALNMQSEQQRFLTLAEREARLQNFVLNQTNHDPDHRKRWIKEKMGYKNPKAWRETLTQIRADASVQLEKEVNEQKGNPQGKLAVLTSAREMQLFNEHINNSVLAGAFGNTGTVGKLDARIKEVQKQVSHPTPALSVRKNHL